MKNFKLNVFSRYPAVVCLMSILAGCGGSGSGGNAVTDPDTANDTADADTNTNICRGEIPGSSISDSGDPVGDILTGHFADSAVAGLTYSTATQSGITDAAGTFMYKPGEAITFSVGGIVLGETVAAKAEMTPYDLVPEATLCTTNRQVEKLLKLSLQEPERKAFNIFTNTLIFLQTLDEDNNPDNGINIPAEINTMFEGVTLNFEQDFRDFSDRDKNAALRKIANLAGNDGLLAYGGIRKPGKALDHFYATQGIQSEFAEIGEEFISDTVWTFDTNGNLVSANDKGGRYHCCGPESYLYDVNGNPLSINDYYSDHAGSSTTEYTYFPDGERASWKEIYRGLGGTRIHTKTYSTNGQLLSSKEEWYDGPLITEVTYTYNSEGKLLSVITDNGDGNTSEKTYTYSAGGELLTLIEVGSNGETSSKYTYNTEGKVLELFEIVSNGVTQSKTYTYNEGGNLLSEIHEILYLRSGNTKTYTTTYTYNEVGNLQSYIREILALSSGYSETYTGTYTYDENGNLLSFISNNADFSSGITKMYTYDDESNLREVVENRRSVERLDTETYTYDANGNILSHLIESNVGTGIPDVAYVDEYTYHANGELASFVSRIVNDYERDGIVNSSEEKAYTYDEDGYKLTYSEGSNTVFYTYDANGNLLSITDDSGVTEYPVISTNWFGFLWEYELLHSDD